MSNHQEPSHRSVQGQSGTTTETGGLSLAPPAFQLMASDGGDASPLQLQPDGPKGATETQESPPQGSPNLLTITDKNSLLREGPPNFASLGKKIPQGTRVEILEEQVVGKSTYIRVKGHDSGAELGWTSKGNSADLDKRYANAAPSYTYHVDGHDLLVFVPPGVAQKSAVDVFVFFHGRGGDYTTNKTHTPGTNEFADNPAISANMAQAAANSGKVAICPQGHGFKVDTDWGAIGAGGFKKMVDVSLSHLSTDLGMAESPLTAGNVSLAGHSAGGNALGQAAQDTGATDVTLQEAGYNFLGSWIKLREWFLLGKGPKTARVITQNNSKGKATRTLVNDGATFSAEQIVQYSKKLVKEGKLPGPVKVEEFTGDGSVESGNIVMERGFRVLLHDGTLQGSLRLYHLEDPKSDHWAASSQTMESSMTAGAADRAADAKAMKDR